MNISVIKAVSSRRINIMYNLLTQSRLITKRSSLKVRFFFNKKKINKTFSKTPFVVAKFLLL